MEEVRLIILNTNEIDIDELLKQSSLSFDDESITNEVVLREKKASFYLKNKYIGEYQISSSGKPVSNNTYFNISHSHGVVVLAINDNHPIGVDIELIRDMEDNFKRYVCDDKEYELSKDNNEEFFKIWTNKETLRSFHKTLQELPPLPLGREMTEPKAVRFNELPYETTR